MESCGAECEDLRSSNARMVKGQGLTQVGRFLPIALICSSERVHFGALLRANAWLYFLFSLISQWTLCGFLGGEHLQ